MTSYARITYRDGDSQRTVLLGHISETASILVGTVCDAEGETRWFDGGTTERKHVIAQELITRREPLVMDYHYGRLRSQNRSQNTGI